MKENLGLKELKEILFGRIDYLIGCILYGLLIIVSIFSLSANLDAGLRFGLSVLLLFIGTFIYQTLVNDWRNRKRGEALEEISLQLDRLHNLRSSDELSVLAESGMTGSGLEKITKEHAERLGGILRDQSYMLTSFYGTYSLIFDMMKEAQAGDEFWGFTTILDEWGQDLTRYHELSAAKAANGVKIHRVFMIPANASEDDLDKWSDVMQKQKDELSNSEIFFVFENEIATQKFINYEDVDGRPSSLLKFVEYGFFKYKEKSPVLVYRRGVSEHDLQTKITCDQEKVSARNIFEKIPQEYKYEYVDERQFRLKCKNKAVVYSDVARTTWPDLFKKLERRVAAQGCKEFSDGLKKLGFSEQFPDPDLLSDKLYETTRWRLSPINGLMPSENFFDLLMDNCYPYSANIRARNEFEFTQSPDSFHDWVGHLPLLTNQHYRKFLRSCASVYQNYRDNVEVRKLLDRVYWYTAETGLVREQDDVKILGAAILTSAKECINVSSDDVQKIDFSAEQIAMRDFDYAHIQDVYYVMNSFEDFSNLAEALPQLAKKAASL